MQTQKGRAKLLSTIISYSREPHLSNLLGYLCALLPNISDENAYLCQLFFFSFFLFIYISHLHFFLFTFLIYIYLFIFTFLIYIFYFFIYVSHLHFFIFIYLHILFYLSQQIIFIIFLFKFI